MPVLHQLQPSFNNGEISPLLYDRVDFQKFVSSVKSGKNMFVHPQGGMSNRAGTVMLAQAKETNVRLIPFEFSSNETYVIEFGNGYCRFFTAQGQVVVNQTVDGVTTQVPYEIQSPFATADLDKIRYCQSGDVMYIAWGGIPQTLTRYGHTDWRFADYDFKNGPIKVSADDASATIGKTTATKEINYSSVVSMKMGSYTVLGAETLSSPWEELSTSNSLITVCNGKMFRFQYNSADGNYYLSYSLDGSTWVPIFTSVNFGSFAIPKMAYNNGTYLISSPLTNKVYRFQDFSTIEEVNFGSIYQVGFYSDVYVCNGLFFYPVAFSQGDPIPWQLAVSSDGVSWSQTGISFLGNNSFAYLNNKFYLANPESNVLSIYDSSYQQIGTASLPSYSNKIAVANSKIWVTDSETLGTNNLRYFDDTLNSFVLHTSIQDENGKENYDSLSFSSTTKFVFLGANVYKLESDNSLTRINNYYGSYQFVNYGLSDFYVSSTAPRYSLSSTNYSFSAQDVGRTFVLQSDLDSSLLEGNSIPSSHTSNTVLCKGPWRLDISGTWEGTLTISYSRDNSTWSAYRIYNSNVNATGSFDEVLFIKIICSVSSGSMNYSFSSSGASIRLSCVGNQLLNSNTLYVTPETESLLYWDFVINKTAHISFGLWSVWDSFPTEVDLYQDRIVWTTNNQLDATKISDYTNFGISTDVTDDDAISVIVKDKKIDKINSIVAGQKLAVYSDDGNFVHNNDTFTPNSAIFLKQGATGGSDVKPVVVRNHIIYAHPMKQAISDYAYNFETDGYAGQDITILSNHLFDGKVIKTLAYQQEPYSIIWVLQEEGTVLACTYLRQQNVIAWTPMDFGGTVKSIAVCSTGTEEHLYLAIQRDNVTFVEKMPTRLLSSAPEDCFFVDCGRTYRGAPATTISGLNYLEGKTVVALADGNVIKDLVVENGAITLSVPASVVTVGLPYESELETLTFDASMGDGSWKNRKKRVVAVSVRYNKSRGSVVSVNGHREVEMLKRDQEAYNTPISLKSGFYREILPSAHNEATSVKIRQTDPLPITVVSIIPELEYER